MTTLTDFLKVDGADYPLAEYFNFLYATALRAEMTNTQTITATKELTDNDVQFQVITASGADRTVELAPEAASNHITVIYNASASNKIPIKDDSGATTFITLLPGDWALCMPIFGQTWKIMLQTPSTDWVPAFTNLTVGNGTLTAKYARAGSNIVDFHVELVFGSTTAISGSVSLVLPITPSGYGTAINPIGIARYKDATGGANQGAIQLSSGSSANLIVYNSSATNVTADTLSAIVPFTWAVSDEIEFQGRYFA